MERRGKLYTEFYKLFSRSVIKKEYSQPQNNHTMLFTDVFCASESTFDDSDDKDDVFFFLTEIISEKIFGEESSVQLWESVARRAVCWERDFEAELRQMSKLYFGSNSEYPVHDDTTLGRRVPSAYNHFLKMSCQGWALACRI